MYFHKSTLMKALGPLATLLLHPNRTPGQQCLHPAMGGPSMMSSLQP